MNRVVLVGRITHDLELAYTTAGVAVMSFHSPLIVIM